MGKLGEIFLNPTLSYLAYTLMSFSHFMDFKISLLYIMLNKILL